MFAYIWPIALVIFSNILYHICAKSSPEGAHPFASLTVTYLTGALVCGILYYVLAPRRTSALTKLWKGRLFSE